MTEQRHNRPDVGHGEQHQSARSLAALAVVLATLTGCSISSTENRLPTHCVKAHDQIVGPGSDHVVTLCDQYDRSKP